MIRKLFNSLKKDERGVSALEYAILAGVVVVVVVAALGKFGTKLETAFDNLGTKVVTQVNEK
ncbi:Flp family type IVb pilin [Brenneria goodwinii]|uniref:Pilus assembly protein n=1 Tax=Brenneria goodwinii TaxID=1109412 RepID=A0A0G4JWS7_9GAMM|nr:Flp family type IVb pilin [Brenneria goodwinii]MCG8157105.1 Flp family type IVb pilin [Brenneria goodwinii]MCG8160155.1 Flp family type IVb pilin [Brenneria goodwinii]MCG8164678.1 Flp family type IVb pilin [Brenneria goodwinii]MCG8170616.1 Flp family type IVb pilin [Brenneria goodwinii]MCG8174144.1 Flp family type IVb pilin [Brenneria goodwinii]